MTVALTTKWNKCQRYKCSVDKSCLDIELLQTSKEGYKQDAICSSATGRCSIHLSCGLVLFQHLHTVLLMGCNYV